MNIQARPVFIPSRTYLISKATRSQAVRSGEFLVIWRNCLALVVVDMGWDAWVSVRIQRKGRRGGPRVRFPGAGWESGPLFLLPIVDSWTA